VVPSCFSFLFLIKFSCNDSDAMSYLEVKKRTKLQ